MARAVCRMGLVNSIDSGGHLHAHSTYVSERHLSIARKHTKKYVINGKDPGAATESSKSPHGFR